MTGELWADGQVVCRRTFTLTTDARAWLDKRIQRTLTGFAQNDRSEQ